MIFVLTNNQKLWGFPFFLGNENYNRYMYLIVKKNSVSWQTASNRVWDWMRIFNHKCVKKWIEIFIFHCGRELRHPNLCQFVGACTETPNVCILMEYCPKGALADVLLNDDIPLTWSFRFSFAADVANGMDYLHSHGLVHARLNSSNCVVDDRWSVKITGTSLGGDARAVWLELIRTRKSFNHESKDLVSLMRFNWWINRKRTVKCTLSSVWIINQEII